VRHDDHTILSGRGVIRVEGEAIAGLVAAAAELVEGIRVRRRKRGVEVVVENGDVRAELELAVRYGASLPDAGEAVQRRVHDALERSLGLEVRGVDVLFAELEQGD
jgi:uncharacterized alkaline shock family protein YloU